MHPLSRREFLSLCAACFGGAALSTLLPSSAYAKVVQSNNVSITLNYFPAAKKLIFINLEGAPDGLELLTPYNDPNLADLRGSIYRGVPDKASKTAPLAINSDFAVSAKLPILRELYFNKQYIGFHATSMQHSNRSHFDAQNMLANGTLKPTANQSGWMNRLTEIIAKKASLNATETTMLTIAPYSSSPLVTRGNVRPMLVSGSKQPELSEGYYQALLGNVIADASITESIARKPIVEDGLRLREVFEHYLSKIGNVDALKARIEAMNSEVTRAEVIGSLMSRADGPRIAILNIGGWDSHTAQYIDGNYGTLLSRLNDSITALRANMKGEWNKCAVIIGGEFGRTCKVNGTNGTDHGIATSWHLAGGAVKGGKLIADWPGLREKDMIDGRYLRPTMNIAAVFKGVIAEAFGLSASELNSIFPDSQNVKPMMGLLA
jgi:uncharacterized protein (DUF1501 family)